MSGSGLSSVMKSSRLKIDGILWDFTFMMDLVLTFFVVLFVGFLGLWGFRVSTGFWVDALVITCFSSAGAKR